LKKRVQGKWMHGGEVFAVAFDDETLSGGVEAEHGD
jgi:hypothetical protein